MSETVTLVDREQYLARRMELLGTDYRVLQKLMGKADFELMMQEYLHVGGGLPEYLQTLDSCHPAIIELAEFERALSEALFAANVRALTMDDFAKLSPEDWGSLTLMLHPSVHLLPFEHNILDVWSDVSQQRDAVISKLETPEYVCIWRLEGEGCFRTLSQDQARVMLAMTKGLDFLRLCEMLLETFSEEEVVPWVAQNLRVWVSSNMLVLK